MALNEYYVWDRTQRIFHWINALADVYAGYAPLARIVLSAIVLLLIMQAATGLDAEASDTTTQRPR